MIDDIKNHIDTGVDAKILQYEENAIDVSDVKIDLIELLGGKQNCILINLEKDVERYKSSLKELEKVSIKNFVHLKATDGKLKDKFNLENDLSHILKFLKNFNPDITNTDIKINQFSEINDPNIQIQDGPLGCYCSHLRSMIWGYLNYEDYTIICEDDISITNTEKINLYLKQIPDDWDIICLNSRPKNIEYEGPFYKFTDEFHSGHFYIIRNKAYKTLFENLYPITDQVDVLISNLIKKLNIYNITDTVYQKNIKTNTQNNLHVIANSPNYEIVRKAISQIELLLNYFSDKILPDNRDRNTIIVKNLIYDVIYNFILYDDINRKDRYVEKYEFSNIYKDSIEFHKLVKSIHFFINCSRKGINVNHSALGLANVLLFTLKKFTLHNNSDSKGNLYKAYGFGSSAHTYRLGNDLVKKYNQKLRWTTIGHDNPAEIFKKEIEMLEIVKDISGCPQLISKRKGEIRMKYDGESLYNDFKLPKDWEKQIKKIFFALTVKGIYYPEFRLQNILVQNDKITFVDFGLAELKSDCNNNVNLEKFLKYLRILNNRLKDEKDIDVRHRLISIFYLNHQI